MSVSSARRVNNLKFYLGPKYCDLKLNLSRDLKFYLSDLKAQIGPCLQRRGRSLKFYPDDLRRRLYGLKFHPARGLEFYLGGGLKFRRATSAKDAKTAMKEPLCR